MTDSARKVRVDLGDRAYDIFVGPGLIAAAGGHLAPLLRRKRVAIVKSCEAKAATVAADERESGVRALLNLGHTFG
ncbi:MAG: hypothetical protein CVT73_24655, partial [Alphaproteobacteria bacterium HGW-Alphaproteobacteria-12]